ncbi:SRPBCC domain-containing protein [bacterium]|nr:SRPBCC domain-containing protein [bacterium]
MDSVDLDFKPGRRLRHTTVELRAVSCGTEVHITQAGIPAQIPVEHCNLGWQESLQYLAQMVEPEIPG